jgi:hypothetical protein
MISTDHTESKIKFAQYPYITEIFKCVLMYCNISSRIKAGYVFCQGILKVWMSLCHNLVPFFKVAA